MITKIQLQQAVSQFPEGSLFHAYEGEDTGITVYAADTYSRTRQIGFIHLCDQDDCSRCYNNDIVSRTPMKVWEVTLKISDETNIPEENLEYLLRNIEITDAARIPVAGFKIELIELRKY